MNWETAAACASRLSNGKKFRYPLDEPVVSKIIDDKSSSLWRVVSWSRGRTRIQMNTWSSRNLLASMATRTWTLF